MYIKSLNLVEIKLFRDLNMSFEVDGKPRMWTVLIGENGLGKTTILRSIAMAASGAARTNQLADIPSFRNKILPYHSSSISAKFVPGELRHAWREYPRTRSRPPQPLILESDLSLDGGSSVVSGNSRYSANQTNKEFIVEFPPLPSKMNPFPLDNVAISKWYMDEPLARIRANNTPNWFVVGYGVDRRLPSAGFTPKLDDPAVQRMEPLFDRGPIIATGFADLLETEHQKAEYRKSLKQALLNNPKILPKVSGMELRGRKGSSNGNGLIDGDRFSFGTGQPAVDIPATWLSQGYQGTIAWIADLIGQMFWDAKGPVDLAEMEGLVLIDEIDLHLHPTWQVHLIEALKTTFPRLQFVVTTHSPMILPGLKKEEILRISQTEEGAVVVESVDESPAVMTGSELYEAFFGIEGLFAREVGDQLRRYSYLSSDAYRTDEEDQEMVHIQQSLRQMDVLPKWEPVPRETL